ncbi:MAG TPA: hypothetical protein VFO80_06325 [Sphingomonas sp.]|nr:hypothetical protein [Sphingomonas sp.]
MRRLEPDGILRTAAIVGMGLALSAMAGVGTAHWTMADTSGFYAYPIDRGSPAYARSRPVEPAAAMSGDDYTPTYTDYAAATDSTATSVEPTYRSASGS